MVHFSKGATPSEGGASEGATIPASVMTVAGQVRATTDAKTWHALKRGDAVTSGMLIQTAKKNAGLELRLGETPSLAPRVRLAQNSLLGLKSLKTKGSGAEASQVIELDLRTGQLEGTLPRSAPGLDFEVEFPTGVAGARGDAKDSSGTVYALNASGALAVASGQMVIAMANGSEPQVVGSNQQFDPVTGRVSPLPKETAQRLIQESQE